MRPPVLPSLADTIDDTSKLILPDEKSREGLSVPQIVFEYSGTGGPPLILRKVLPTMIRTIYNVKKSYKSAASSAILEPAPAGDDFIQELKDYAFSLGCLDIGFTTVPSSLIFSNKSLLFTNAIVLSMEMDREAIEDAPGIKSGKEVWNIYRDLGIAVNKISSFIRERGFSAQAGPALGGDVNYPMLAQKAGMGHIGRHGLLISEAAGPRQRLAAVYTNISNLPYSDSNSDQHQWIDDWCSTCRRCLDMCPGQAILDSPLYGEDGGASRIEYKKCAVPFSATLGCSVCIKECVINKKGYMQIKSVQKKKGD
jgi:Pyruvate/2-oxoacid:ferredoxin oxidoreductase delta subunit